MPKTNTYELMFIVRPDLTQEQVNKQMHKYYDILKNNGAEKVSMEVWGKRRLAYPIQNFNDGVYILTYYDGDGSQVVLYERDMRLSEEVIRYLTIKHKKPIEFEEKEVPSVESIPAPSPIPGPPILADNTNKDTQEKEEETKEVTEEVTADADTDSEESTPDSETTPETTPIESQEDNSVEETEATEESTTAETAETETEEEDKTETPPVEA